MEKILGINSFHTTPSREWFETDAVLRVCLGTFLFFTILAILMIGVKSQKDPCDGVHHGGWMMKIICWCVLVIFMFFLPNGIISYYASCRTVVSGISRRSARSAYCGLFALSLIVSWILREAAAFLREKIPGINSFHTALSRELFEADAVLQVSLGNFLFFTILAILMIGVKSQKDPRDGVHHGGWMMKSFVGASWYIALLVTSLIGYVATFAFCCCYAASIGEFSTFLTGFWTTGWLLPW
ncbi:hypothetical protein R3W88_017645 [Solanum pinnatisectum]|uniref:Uncharacterized protein n=1 Tax=Solanum pinnatisectum TaxID=50273 RepID=A0AAV9L503_9SOLN|nr:hypothetical protein R3W88_017645 [Solanum pinnatisectum]